MPRDWQPPSLLSSRAKRGICFPRVSALLAVVGIIVGLALLCYRPNVDRAAVLSQAAALTTEAEHERTAATAAIERAKASARIARRETETAVSQALAARARARVVDADDVMISATPNATSQNLRVPAAVVERMQFDSTAVATLGTLVQWQDSVVVRQDQHIRADSLALVASSNAFATLQRVKEPRCGRRCGIVLGVGSVLAAAVAVEQVRRMFR